MAAAQEKISELQTSLTVAKSDESSHLSQYDDTDISSLPPVGSEETISLCNVISDYSGQKWLIRFADLSHNGHYHMFHRNEELPPYFSNRDKIFYKDGPSTDGFLESGRGLQFQTKRILPRIILYQNTMLILMPLK